VSYDVELGPNPVWLFGRGAWIGADGGWVVSGGLDATPGRCGRTRLCGWLWAGRGGPSVRADVERACGFHDVSGLRGELFEDAQAGGSEPRRADYTTEARSRSNTSI
jgi:hypothetical protein